MAHKQDRAAFPFRDRAHFSKALLLKLGISHREHFIHDQNLRLHVGGHRKGKTHIHAAGVSFHGSIEKLLDLGKGHDFIEPLPNLSTAHPKNGSIEKDVLASGQFRVKASPHLQQAGHTAIYFNSTRGGFGNAADYFKQRTFARAIAPDNTHDFAALDLERNIF